MRSPRRGVAVVVLCCLCAFAGTQAGAQPTLRDAVGTMLDPAAGGDGADSANNVPSPAAKPSPPGDELNRQTPRGAVTGFLEAARARDWERAAEYLFLGNLPTGWTSDDGPVLARQLKVVLDRTLWIDVPALSREPEGHRDDGLPENRDWVGRIQSAGGPVDVFMHRVRLPNGERVWKFASVTIARVPDLYAEFGDGPLANLLPPVFFEFHVLDMQLWQLVGLGVISILAMLFAFLVTGFVGWVLRRLSDGLTARLSPLVIGPLRLLLFVLVLSAARLPLSLPLRITSIVAGIETLLRVVAFTWAALRILDVVAQQLTDRLIAQRQASAIGLVPPGRRIAQILILTIGAVVALSEVGFNVTALVAGLGVGGIAVALAAQKSIEHLFGGATLYADRPVKVGDFCRFGDKMGTIELIGLRSTRVRTLDRTILTIPNAEFSNLQLENFSARDKFRFCPRISLRYETTPDQMRYVLIEIRKLLYRHPKVDLDPCRVRFTTFGAFSLDIDILAYILAKDMNEFLAITEDINLRIIEIVNQAGAGFAFPSQTLYVENGTPPDAELRDKAEEQVRRWRSDNALYVTEFPPERIAEMLNTLTYPPESGGNGT